MRWRGGGRLSETPPHSKREGFGVGICLQHRTSLLCPSALSSSPSTRSFYAASIWQTAKPLFIYPELPHPPRLFSPLSRLRRGAGGEVVLKTYLCEGLGQGSAPLRHPIRATGQHNFRLSRIIRQHMNKEFVCAAHPFVHRIMQCDRRFFPWP